MALPWQCEDQPGSQALVESQGALGADSVERTVDGAMELIELVVMLQLQLHLGEGAVGGEEERFGPRGCSRFLRRSLGPLP